MKHKKTERARISRLDADAKQELLARASRVLRRQGFAATTIRELAAALDVGPSTFYYHFRDKDDLFVQTLQSELSSLAARVERAGKALPKDRGIDQLERVLREITTFQLDWQAMVEGEPARVRSLNYLVGALPESVRLKTIPHERSILNTVRATLEAGKKDGSMDVLDVTMTAFAVMAPSEQLIIWYRPDGRLPPAKAIKMCVALALRIVARTAPVLNRSTRRNGAATA